MNITLKFFLTLFLCLCVVLPVSGDVSLNVRDVIVKLSKDLALTDAQIKQVEPIIKKSMVKRKAYFEKWEEGLFSNKKLLKAAMLKLRTEEEQELRRVLTAEQMNKLVAKRQFRDSLNKDNIDFSEGLDAGGMSLEGPRMQF